MTLFSTLSDWGGAILANSIPPSEEFEFTANTLQAHMKTHCKLILKPLIYLTANSQDDLTL